MDKPTERQPLDDFFRRNLNDASVLPGTDAWNRLQSRLAVPQASATEKPIRRIGVAWYWSASVAAAACLLIAFLWVGRTTQPSSENNKSDLAATTPTDKKAPKNNRIEEQSVVVEKDRLADVSTPGISAESSRKPQVSLTDKSLGENAQYAVVPATEPKAKLEQHSLADNAVDNQVEKTQVNPASERNNAIAFSKGEAPPKATLPTPERTLIVSVVEPAPEQIPTETAGAQEEGSTVAKDVPIKNSRITNVFRQIKRLKDGEVMAKAEGNSNDEDDESGLFNRLVRSTRSKENQIKQQK